jgi:hypothetical protein
MCQMTSERALWCKEKSPPIAPDHRHLWRGIHHPELVASGLAPQVAVNAAGAPRSETMRSTVIAPDVRSEDDHWIELSDTQLFTAASPFRLFETESSRP